MPNTPEYIVDVVEDSEDDRKKILKYRCFYPSFPDKKIVNARYGSTYDWYPNTIDSLRLFKVINSTACFDKKGYNLTQKEDIYKEPHFLYYDTPEQYARHSQVKITNKMVLQWHEKQKLIFPNGIFSTKGYNEWKNKKNDIF